MGGMMGSGSGMMAPGMRDGDAGAVPHGNTPPGYFPGELKGPLTKERAAEIVGGYLASTRNSYLKLGQITDKGSYFEAELVTKKSGEPAAKVWIDKQTGYLRPGS